MSILDQRHPRELFDEHTRQELAERIEGGILAPFRVFWSDWRSRVGLFIVLFFIFLGTGARYIVPRPRTHQGPLMEPAFQSLAHPLGTDVMGQDILSAMVYGTTPLLKMMLAGCLFATFVAVVVGTTSAYKGGNIERVLNTFTDIAMTIPGLPLIIVVGFIIEPRSPYVVGIILTLNAWAGLARMIHSEVLSIREESYVEASHSMGLGTSRIIRTDILPGIMPFVLIGSIGMARSVIFNSVVLYFLGILPFTEMNWGVIMNYAYESASGAPIVPRTFHWIMAPMLAIILFTLGLIFMSQGLDRIFNPRLRAKHEKTSSDELSLPSE